MTGKRGALGVYGKAHERYPIVDAFPNGKRRKGWGGWSRARRQMIEQRRAKKRTHRARRV